LPLLDHVPLAGVTEDPTHFDYFPDSFAVCLTGVPDAGIPGLNAPLPEPVQLSVGVARTAAAWLA
jgi:hypothetical protein